MANNTVILKNSSVPDKMPTSAATVGEVFVNYASGDGKSFLSTKKADDTIAVFREDAYWQAKLDEKVTAINLIKYQSEDDLITADGPFDVYIKSVEEGDGIGLYMSSHHRYLIYGDSMIRIDCLTHGMETNLMNKGTIYSMMLLKGNNTWSLQYYIDDNGVYGPDLQEIVMDNDEETEANHQQMLNIVRTAFNEFDFATKAYVDETLNGINDLLERFLYGE